MDDQDYVYDYDYEIDFTALAEPIEQRLIEDGVKYKKKIVREFQKEADAIDILWAGRIISDRIMRKLFKKLNRHIIYHLEEENPNRKKEQTA